MTTVFAAWLAATIAALVVVLVSGRAARRSLHYASVLVFFALLFFTIGEAGEIGRGLKYEGWVETVFTAHFVLVGLDFLVVPVLIVTGLRLARSDDRRRRRQHVLVATGFVVLVVLTCALGTLMTWGATPIAGV